MEIWRHLSRNDFFNYYFAGVIWSVNLILFISLVAPPTLPDKLEFSWLSSASGVLIIGVLVIVLPYILGFITEPLGRMVTSKFRKKFESEAIDYKSDANRGSRLAFPMRNSILEMAKNIFGELKNKELYFSWIRAYVWQKGGAVAELANRAQAMSNLAESLIVPITLLGFLFPIWVSILFEISAGYGAFFGLLLSLSLTYLVRKRYQVLREYYVKHVYRAFLILEEVNKR